MAGNARHLDRCEGRCLVISRSGDLPLPLPLPLLCLAVAKCRCSCRCRCCCSVLAAVILSAAKDPGTIRTAHTPAPFGPRHSPSVTDESASNPAPPPTPLILSRLATQKTTSYRTFLTKKSIADPEATTPKPHPTPTTPKVRPQLPTTTHNSLPKPDKTPPHPTKAEIAHNSPQTPTIPAKTTKKAGESRRFSSPKLPGSRTSFRALQNQKNSRKTTPTAASKDPAPPHRAPHSGSESTPAPHTAAPPPGSH